MTPLDLARGAAATLTLPFCLSRPRLSGLMAEPPTTPSARGGADGAVRAALLTLRVLSVLRVPGWRNTCLYRSIVRCRLLRRAGHPAVLRIGAARPGSEGQAAMHAWVEVIGEPVVENVERFTLLRSHSAPR